MPDQTPEPFTAGPASSYIPVVAELTAERDRFKTELAAVRDAAYRQRQALDAERTQWQAEIAHLRDLIRNRAFDETITVADIRKALREGPQTESEGTTPVPGSSRRAPEPAFAEGYAEAVARLRDDARYRDWWTSGGVKPDAPIRRHLADYLETVGPDGIDVTTGRWPAREQAVVRAAIAWRKMRAGSQQAIAAPQARALMEAVDALPAAGESKASEPAKGEFCHRHWSWLCQAGQGQCLPATPAPAAPKLAQGGVIRRDVGPIVVGEDQLLERMEALPVEPAVADESGPLVAPVDGTPRETAAGRCGPDCSEGHTYEAGCAIKPPARAFLGERPCGRPGCPCGS